MTISEFFDSNNRQPGYALAIREFVLEKNVNTHSVLHFAAVVDQDEIEPFYAKLGHKIVVRDDENKTIFQGYVADIDIAGGHHGDMEVVIFSLSKKTDLTPHCRVFQNTKKTFKQIMEKVSSDSPSEEQFTVTCEEDPVIEGPVVQYHETNFEFLVRLAKECGLYVYVEDSEKPSFHVTAKVHGGQVVLDEKRVYVRHKAWKFYEGNGSKECFLVHTDMYAAHGCGVSTQLANCILFEWRMEKLEGGKYTYIYRLFEPNNVPVFRQPISPERIFLKAKVKSNQDPESMGRIQVEITDDEYTEPDKGNNLPWIPYRTPYAGEKGSKKWGGIHFLPDENDTVEVIFSRGSFFAGEALREEKLDNDVKDPEEKHIADIFRHRISFTKDMLELRAGEDATITLKEDEIVLKMKDSQIKMEKDTILITAKSQTIQIGPDSEGIKIDGSKKIAMKSSKLSVDASSEAVIASKDINLK